MTDRELLEPAAKAAGIGPINPAECSSGLWIDFGQKLWKWAPLADDGAALRLAKVKRMIVDFRSERVWYMPESDAPSAFSRRLNSFSPVQSFRYKAIDFDGDYRRAIVRAAAEEPLKL